MVKYESKRVVEDGIEYNEYTKPGYPEVKIRLTVHNKKQDDPEALLMYLDNHFLVSKHNSNAKGCGCF